MTGSAGALYPTRPSPPFSGPTPHPSFTSRRSAPFLSTSRAIGGHPAPKLSPTDAGAPRPPPSTASSRSTWRATWPWHRNPTPWATVCPPTSRTRSGATYAAASWPMVSPGLGVPPAATTFWWRFRAKDEEPAPPVMPSRRESAPQVAPTSRTQPLQRAIASRSISEISPSPRKKKLTGSSSGSEASLHTTIRASAAPLW